MKENAETRRTSPLTKVLIWQKTRRENAESMRNPNKIKQAQGMLLSISLCLFMFCWA